MWKEFFFFSGSQRAGIIVLTVLIVSAVILSAILPAILPQPEVDTDDTAFRLEIERFKASLVVGDSLRNEQRKRYTTTYQLYSDRKKDRASDFERFPFDPNTLDSVGLASLGIPPYVVSNILRYRRKGGFFTTSEKFGAVYGMKPELYAELEPYVEIEHQLIRDVPIEQPATTLVVDLNSADSTQLMQIKGIGRGIARSILRFRAASGGFVSTTQLSEVYGMTDDLFGRIRPYCVADPSTVKKIQLNTASVDKLRSHPYLNFYQAKAIYELRRRKGKLHSIDQLRHLEELNDSTLLKIGAYLSFE